MARGMHKGPKFNKRTGEVTQNGSTNLEKRQASWNKPETSNAKTLMHQPGSCKK